MSLSDKSRMQDVALLQQILTVVKFLKLSSTMACVVASAAARMAEAGNHKAVIGGCFLLHLLGVAGVCSDRFAAQLWLCPRSDSEIEFSDPKRGSPAAIHAHLERLADALLEAKTSQESDELAVVHNLSFMRPYMMVKSGA